MCQHQANMFGALYFLKCPFLTDPFKAEEAGAATQTRPQLKPVSCYIWL